LEEVCKPLCFFAFSSNKYFLLLEGLIRKLQARLALCEAITVLFLHQNKSPPIVPSALTESNESKVDWALGPKVMVDNQLASAIEKDSVDLASKDIIPVQKSMKPKTLLELAQGDFDLLDEPTPSNSALENTHIEIECIVDEALVQHNTVASLALMNSTQELVVRLFSLMSI
jgi:hypothetical protein